MGGEQDGSEGAGRETRRNYTPLEPGVSMERILEFLHESGSYPHEAGDVEVHETHISKVFLVGGFAYKLKKPVSFDFVDSSTRERREHCASEEVRLNRRLTRGIYLGLSFVRQQEGELRLDVEGNGPGRKVAALVRMKRLPRECMLDELVVGGEARRDHIDQLVDLLVPFYRNAAIPRERQRAAGLSELRKTLFEDLQATERFVGNLLPTARQLAIRSALCSFLTLESDRFERRIDGGKVRDGHGDLKAEHVAFVPECSVIDCIEFNERFRFGDVAADIALLKMDLEFLGAGKLADYFLERYIEASGDEGIRQVFDFYLSHRAYVRGKVEALTLENADLTRDRKKSLERRARRHFLLSGVYAHGLCRPFLVLVGGLSGTGKTTVSQALSEAVGSPAIDSDVVRRAPAGMPAAGGSPEKETTEGTYRSLSQKAEGWLEQGASVIVDATFSKRRHRRLFEGTAQRTGADRIEFECRVPRQVATARLREREEGRAGLSDTTVKIRETQERSYESPGAGEAIPLDTDKPVQEILDVVLETIKSRSRGPAGSAEFGLPGSI